MTQYQARGSRWFLVWEKSSSRHRGVPSHRHPSCGALAILAGAGGSLADVLRPAPTLETGKTGTRSEVDPLPGADRAGQWRAGLPEGLAV